MSLQDSIAAGYKINKDANLQDFVNIIGCRLSNASPILQKNIALAMLQDPNTLIRRQKIIDSFRKKPRDWEKHFARIASIEKEITPFFESTTSDKDSLENDSIAQLSFQDDICKPLNYIPWVIFLVAIFKIWIVPAATLLTPIIAWIIPYILLKFVYALPIDQNQYTTIIQNLWTGNMSIPAEPPDLFSPRSIAQFLIFSFSFAQGMIQPIQAAMHLYKTDSIIGGIGEKLVELRRTTEILRTESKGLDIHLSHTLDDLDSTDFRRSFLIVKEDPERVRMVLRDLAELEILWCISQSERLHPVIFKPGTLFLQDMLDISLDTGIPSTVHLFDKEHHAIITGPNGGGKSSFLRATLQSIVLGHSYGVAPAVKAIMPRFYWIASGLQLRDTPGLYSMSETEVKFAADCIQSAKNSGPGFVLFDELFHSTNPPDGARSADLFLKQLWATNAYSIISTHVFPLVENKPDTVQAICCPASQQEGGDIVYSYRATPGICRVSSVHTVWKRYGLERGNEPKVKVSTTRRNDKNAI